MSPEEKDAEVFRSAENRPKREDSGSVIYWLVMLFDGNTYKSGKHFFMREKESKDKTDSFMKVATDVIFKKLYAKAGIKKFG